MLALSGKENKNPFSLSERERDREGERKRERGREGGSERESKVVHSRSSLLSNLDAR